MTETELTALQKMYREIKLAKAKRVALRIQDECYAPNDDWDWQFDVERCGEILLVEGIANHPLDNAVECDNCQELTLGGPICSYCGGQL
jgi:hypothetical protein